MRYDHIARRRNHHEIFRKVKEQTPCFDCGGQYEHYCMDYDHVRGVKKYSISKMVSHSKSSIINEIEKCDLVCIMCHRTRTHLNKVKKKPSSHIQEIRSAKRANIKDVVNSMKTGPCRDCGKCFESWQMDFDHRPGTEKYGDVSFLVGSLNLGKVLSEIEKCDLVCALCHRRRTHSRNEYAYGRKPRPQPQSDGREPWRVNLHILEKDKDAVIEMYSSGRIYREIAEFCGVSLKTVAYFIDKVGLLPRGKGRRHSLSVEHQNEVCALYLSGRSAADIGRHFGTSKAIIRGCLKKYGIRRCDFINSVKYSGSDAGK